MGAVVGAWSRLTFAIGFDDEATEVRNQGIDFVGLFFPPARDLCVKRVCSFQPAEFHWCGETRGQVNVQAISAKDGGDCGNFLKIVRREYLRVSVDVV